MKIILIQKEKNGLTPWINKNYHKIVCVCVCVCVCVFFVFFYDY